VCSFKTLPVVGRTDRGNAPFLKAHVQSGKHCQFVASQVEKAFGLNAPFGEMHLSKRHWPPVARHHSCAIY